MSPSRTLVALSATAALAGLAAPSGAGADVALTGPDAPGLTPISPTMDNLGSPATQMHVHNARLARDRAARRHRAQLRRRAHDRRVRARAARATRAADATRPTGALAAIAQCESGGDPGAIGGGGAYRGLYQFSSATWAAVGGSGDPAAASIGEQTRRAQILYDQAGPGQWPICGR